MVLFGVAWNWMFMSIRLSVNGAVHIARITRVIGAAGIMVILYFSVQLKANSNIKRVEVTLKSSTNEKLIAKTDIIKYLNKSRLL